MKIVKKLIISALVLVFATGVFAGCKGTERSVDERNVWVDGNKVYKDSYAGKEIIKSTFSIRDTARIGFMKSPKILYMKTISMH